jgi:CTP:molybdopterin cytidylyltransferase MocA
VVGTAGLVLAAGAGRRYGRPKALVEVDGRLLVERAAQTLREAGCDPVVVVLGAAADQVRATARLGGCQLLDNPQWSTGIGSSLRAGLAGLAESESPAAVVLLVDMPGITAAAVRRVAGFAEPDALVVACYGEACEPDRHYCGQRQGHPVLIGRHHWQGVAELAVGDTGARPYLRAHAAAVRVVPCADVADDTDLDYPTG